MALPGVIFASASPDFPLGAGLFSTPIAKAPSPAFELDKHSFFGSGLSELFTTAILEVVFCFFLSGNSGAAIPLSSARSRARLRERESKTPRDSSAPSRHLDVSFFFLSKLLKVRSSSEPGSTRNSTMTLLCIVPIRWARASACSTAPGTKGNSANMTKPAAVKVIPSAQAVTERSAMRHFGFVWKSFTRFALLSDGVLPSIRMWCNPSCDKRFSSKVESPSITIRWCAKIIAFSSPRSKTSSTCSLTAGNLISAIFRNIDTLSSVSSKSYDLFCISFICLASAQSKGTFCLRFGGNSCKTSFFKRLTITVLAKT
mmetsp:Transcript_14393/g.23559  ORF Transcript_14393/g.23559 Transcript_14393/m.23559 type:complete len:315 (-) Transcript_14393:1312-2256(-)